MSQSCKSCRFFSQVHRRHYGRCVAYPPVLSRDVERLEEGWRGEWPFVLQTDWCGEYSSKHSPATGVRVASVEEVD